MAGTAARRRAAAAVLVCALVAVGVLVAVRHRSADSQDSPDSPASTDPLMCNGSTALCDRRLDEVALLTTHNSMAATADGFRGGSQTDGIPVQLERGVHGFLIDAWLGSRRRVAGHDVIHTERKADPARDVLNALTSSAKQQALALHQVAARLPATGPTEVYLCHEYCEIGAQRLSDAVSAVRQFLEDHPDQVLVVVIQDELPARRLLPDLEPLSRYLARIDPRNPPTLGALVRSGKRLVLGLENGDLGPKIPNVYADGLIQEVPYSYRSVEAVGRASSCRPNRGSDQAPILLLNNWVSPASSSAAEQVNAEDFLVARATTCARVRGRPVNLVAVDFDEIGDAGAAVAHLNAH